jgi:hypothetical protein
MGSFKSVEKRTTINTMGYKDKYKNMGKSNLTFLNADGGQATHEQILLAIEKEKQEKIQALFSTTPNVQEFQIKKNVIIAEAEAKVKAENRRFDLEKLFGKVSGTLTTTQSILSSLGIESPAKNTNAPIKGEDDYTPPKNEKDNTLLIVGGVVVALGIVSFIIYKVQK